MKNHKEIVYDGVRAEVWKVFVTKGEGIEIATVL
jgi:hypothetical protein